MPEDAIRDVGAYLREARERAGITLRAIATTTKISVLSLEALERNDVGRLPGGIFVRAFVRAYAKEVGLDPEDAVRRYIGRFPDAAVEGSPTPHAAHPENIVVVDDSTTSRVWRVLGWSLPLALVIVYFGFGGRLSWWREQVQPGAPRVEHSAEPPPPAPTAPVLTTPASTAPAANTATSLPPAGSSSVAAASPGAAADALPRPGDPPRLTQAPAPAADATAVQADDGRFHLSLAPRGRCWVTIRSNGKVVFSGTMNPGDRRDLVLGGNVSLTLGNAGVMGVEIDGQPARSLGGDGQVVTALMNIQNLKSFLEPR